MVDGAHGDRVRHRDHLPVHVRGTRVIREKDPHSGHSRGLDGASPRRRARGLRSPRSGRVTRPRLSLASLKPSCLGGVRSATQNRRITIHDNDNQRSDMS